MIVTLKEDFTLELLVVTIKPNSKPNAKIAKQTMIKDMKIFTLIFKYNFKKFKLNII